MFDRRELLLLATASASAPAAKLSAAAAKRLPQTRTRKAEIAALRTFAEETHPLGREARDDANWRARWSELERKALLLSDGEYFVGARHALAWFEDGHTTVLPFEYLGKVPDPFARGPFALHLPWRVRTFDDGAYIVAAGQEGRSHLGERVEEIGRLSTAALLEAFDKTWPGNRAWAHNWAGSLFGWPAQLQALGATANAADPLPVRVAGGRRFLIQPTPQPSIALSELTRTKAQRESWAEAAKRGNYVKVLPGRRAIYISIDDMDDVEGATFEQFTREAFAAMNEAAGSRLIVDLRRNGGGDNFLGEPLRKHIERSQFNQPGRLFVLIGPATFSAAQNLANRLERETYAIFVGGPSGLAPNHYGDAKIFTGPVTGLTAMVSTLPWFDSYPQDKREWITPDLLVPSKFDDWRAGGDPVLDAALTQPFIGMPDDLSRDRVFYYSRASQKQQWNPFWV